MRSKTKFLWCMFTRGILLPSKKTFSNVILCLLLRITLLFFLQISFKAISNKSIWTYIRMCLSQAKTKTSLLSVYSRKLNQILPIHSEVLSKSMLAMMPFHLRINTPNSFQTQTPQSNSGKRTWKTTLINWKKHATKWAQSLPASLCIATTSSTASYRLSNFSNFKWFLHSNLWLRSSLSIKRRYSLYKN